VFSAKLRSGIHWGRWVVDAGGRVFKATGFAEGDRFACRENAAIFSKATRLDEGDRQYCGCFCKRVSGILAQQIGAYDERGHSSHA
jgi:hypothetical protein